MTNLCVYNVVVNDTPVTHRPWSRIVHLTTDTCINITPESVYAQEAHQDTCTWNIDLEITLQHAIYCCESVISLLPFLPVQFSRFLFSTPPASRSGKTQNLHCITGKRRQPNAAQYKFYTLARFNLLINVDITILYPNTQTLTVNM